MKKRNIIPIAVLGALAVLMVMLFGRSWIEETATRDTNEAVRSVSLLYLDELAGRREQVVSKNLEDRIHDIEVSLSLIEENDLSDQEHLQAYQKKMKTLFSLDKFAFVGSEGLIYTSTGTQDDIDTYPFDYRTLNGPEVSIKGSFEEGKEGHRCGTGRRYPVHGRSSEGLFHGDRYGRDAFRRLHAVAEERSDLL